MTEQILKTKTIELPTWEQLTKDEQSQVLKNYIDFNVSDFDWWSGIYEDAKTLGFSIKHFNLDNGYIHAETNSRYSSIARMIIETHGESCSTYKMAKTFLEVEDISLNDGAQFHKYLENEYLIILREEYDYRTSDEAIEQALIANDYTFNRETLRIDQ